MRMLETPIPPIPTDNLYKFLALSGLVLIVSSLWFFGHSVHENSQEILKFQGELDILSNERQSIDDEMKRANRHSTEVVARLVGELQMPLDAKTNLWSLLQSNRPVDVWRELYSYTNWPALTNPYQSHDVLMSNAWERYNIAEIQNLTNVTSALRALELKTVEARNKERMIEEASKDNNRGFGIYIATQLLGCTSFLLGLIRWYTKVQVYQDQILRNEAEDRPKRQKKKVTDTKE